MTLLNQSTESADGSGCLKFYRPLELIGIFAEIKVLFGTESPFSVGKVIFGVDLFGV